MSVQMRPGRWRMRSGRLATVEDCKGDQFHRWRGRDDDGVRYTWRDSGEWFNSGDHCALDLVEYLGPIEQIGGGK